MTHQLDLRALQHIVAAEVAISSDPAALPVIIRRCAKGIDVTFRGEDKLMQVMPPERALCLGLVIAAMATAAGKGGR